MAGSDTRLWLSILQIVTALHFNIHRPHNPAMGFLDFKEDLQILFGVGLDFRKKAGALNSVVFVRFRLSGWRPEI